MEGESGQNRIEGNSGSSQNRIEARSGIGQNGKGESGQSKMEGRGGKGSRVQGGWNNNSGCTPQSVARNGDQSSLEVVNKKSNDENKEPLKLKPVATVINLKVNELRKRGIKDFDEWDARPNTMYIGRHNGYQGIQGSKLSGPIHSR